MWSAASIAEAMSHAKHFGYNGVAEDWSFDWPTMKKRRDANVLRLNGIYKRNVLKDGITALEGTATITGPNTVSVNDVEYTVCSLFHRSCQKHNHCAVPEFSLWIM